jgi:hypothetical protein
VFNPKRTRRVPVKLHAWYSFAQKVHAVVGGGGALYVTLTYRFG